MSRRGLGTAHVVVAMLIAAIVGMLVPTGAGASTLPAGFEETTALPGVGKAQDIAIAPNGRVFVAEKTGFIRTFRASTTRRPRCSPTCACRYTTSARVGCCRSSWTRRSRPSRTCTSTTRWTRRSAARRPCTAAGPSTRARSTSIPGRGRRQAGRADDRPARQLPGRSAHLAAPGRRRGHGRRREGAGRGLLPAVRLPRRRRPRPSARTASSTRRASDGSTSQFWDWGQSGSPKNPCGDPPGGVGASLTRPTSEGGRLRAQDVRTTGDPTGLSGSVIRIDPPPRGGHQRRASNAKRIVAYGMRDATRLAIRPGTNDIWVADRGGGYWEEFHRVTPGPRTSSTSAGPATRTTRSGSRATCRT